MFALLREFFMVKSVAIRSLRVVLVAVGMFSPEAAVAYGVELPGWLRFVFYLLALVGAAVTGDDSTSGLPSGEEPR